MRIPILSFIFALALGVVALVASVASAVPPGNGQGVVNENVSFASTDQLIVTMQPGESPNAAALSQAAGLSVTIERDLGSDTVVVRLPSAQADARLKGLARAMANSSGVALVEPDVRMFAVTSDPNYSQQWDLGPAGPNVYGIDVEGAWAALTNPASVTVAVADTGYVDHQDLAVLPGYDFVSDSRIGNDGNGRDSDAHDTGDWITSQESGSGFFRGCQQSDSSWHGTHVAGTIAALTNNGTGIAGINPSANILPVRVLGKCGGYTSDITDGVRWAAGLSVSGVPNNPNVAKVVNLSLGGGGACSAIWQNTINAVTAAGTVVVVAAGNSNVNAANFSPASCDGVISVASTGKAGSRAYYSNYGTSVEIAAPGGDRIADNGDTILSTLNSGQTSPVASPGGDTYAKYQGTSMAAPHVAGIVSLMLSGDPTLTPAQVLQTLEQTATPFPGGSSCSSSTCGAGIANAAGAVAAVTGGGPGTTTTTTMPTTTTTMPTTTTTMPTTTTTMPTTTTTATTTTTTTTTPPAVPGVFMKSRPADGNTRIKRSVTLSWEASSGADEYWVCIEVDSTPDGVCNSFSYGPYTGTSARIRGLERSATYEWQVQADNSFGSTDAAGGAWQFRTR